MAGYTDNPSAQLHSGKFTDGDPLAGIPSSRILAEQTNNIVDELNNILALAGVAPDFSENDQVAAVIAQYIADQIAEKTNGVVVAAFAAITFSETSYIMGGLNVVAVERLVQGSGYKFRIHLEPTMDWDVNYEIGFSDICYVSVRNDMYAHVEDESNAGKWIEVAAYNTGTSVGLGFFFGSIIILRHEV